MVTVSAKGLLNGLSTSVNDGAKFGVDTIGTTTSGLQEAINALIANTNRTVPPAGGGIVRLQAGSYLCTSQVIISNRFANPITIEGVSDAPATIIRLQPGSGKDGIVTAAPVSTGNLSLNLRNLILAYEGLYKQYICNFTDVQRLQCDNVYFCSWGFVTNGGLDGNVFSSYATTHGANVVGIKIGTYDFSDSPFGLAIFNNCRFADLAAGAYTTIDHTWFNKCHFLLIGGSSKSSPGTNSWTAGGAFTIPDSMFALHPAIVNNSLNGDVRIDDPNIYFTYCFLLNAHQGAFGHPLIRNTTPGGLESSGWIVLQYDDIDSGNEGQRVDIETEPDNTMLGSMSLVKKPGTISYRYPANLRIFKAGSYAYGGYTNLSLLKGSLSVADLPGFNMGVVGGLNKLLGTNNVEALQSGVTLNPASITVSGGTIAGINGSYFLSDRIFREDNGSINTFSWTNANYAYVWNESIFALNASGGGFYLLGDSNMVRTLYDGGSSFQIYPGTILKGQGASIADGTNGTPPSIAFTLTTNAGWFAGAVTASQFTGSGQSLTNVLRHPAFRKIGYIDVTGEGVIPAKVGDTIVAEAGATTTGIAPTATEGSTLDTASIAGAGSPFGWRGTNNWRVGRNIYFGTSAKLQQNSNERACIAIGDTNTVNGFTDADNAMTLGVNFAAFRYFSTLSDSTWKAVTCDGTATTTTTDTGVAVDTLVHRFEIIENSSVPNFVFKIDGVPKATNTTHLPTVGTSLKYLLGGTTTDGVAKNIRIEWIWLEADR
jgi:hypothetical protein